MALLIASTAFAYDVDSVDIVSIQEVRQDADGDGRPDGLGRQVTLAGWVSSDSHHFAAPRFDVFMQDESGGIQLRGGASLERVEEGQRVIAAGLLKEEEGLLVLDQVEFRILPSPLRLLQPEDLNRLPKEAAPPFGRLVSLKGSMVSLRDEPDGRRVVVNLGRGAEDEVVLFWSSARRERFSLNDYAQGAELTIQGILARSVSNLPWSPCMEVWPRTAQDVRRSTAVATTPHYRVWAVLLGVFLLGLLYSVFRNQGKKNSAALREIHERFQTIYESAADAILVVEVSGKIHSANPATEKLTGYSSMDLRDFEFTRFLADASPCRWGEMVLQTPGEGSGVLEVPITRADGGEVVVEIKTSAIELSGTSFYMVLMRDITVRKKAEIELFKEKELLAVTLASIEGGVITTDIQGQVMSMNRAAEKLCRLKQEDGVGMPFSKVLKLSTSSKWPVDPVTEAIRMRKTVELPADTCLVSAPDTAAPLRVVCAPLMSSEHNVIGVVVVFEDVSHRFQAEEELQKATKLESIGTLAGGIAHDFNNIMTSVIGNLSLANTFLEASPVPEVKACIEHAQRSSQRAKSLTAQLLTFSTGGDPVKETASVAAVLKDAGSFALSGSSIKVKQVLEDNLWPVNVDIHQIVQAISNILINAKEACPSGVIVIRACNLRLNPLRSTSRVRLNPGRYIQITITDEGGGIPADIQPKIFDPYFSTKEKGSGLGLAATYSIIKNHGGSIEADSEPGKGAVFTLYMPASDRAVKKVIKPPSELVHGSGRILIMDDELAIRRMAAYMVKKMGFEADGAASGEEAIEMYIRARDQGTPYTVILMDLTIPGGMGGQEAMARLLELDPDVKAIVSSGYFTDPVMSQYEEYGFVGVLAKPYSIQELGAAIEDALHIRTEAPAV